MPLELSLPFLALAGAAVVIALAYRYWPSVQVRTYTEHHEGFSVREIALISSRRRRREPLALGEPERRRSEFVIYLTHKVCNQ
jgi:hypothetical protein